MTDGPCGWTASPCEDCCDDTIQAIGPELWETMQQLAVWILWRATGQQYGLCENTYRPCRRNCDGSYGWPIGAPWIPWRINDQWVNLSCQTCVGSCGCGGIVSEVRLSDVHAVTGLTIDGEDLVPEDVLAVYNRHRIVRIDGEQLPSCQNLSAKGGVGTWSITVLQGTPVPAGGELVAGILACELAKACAQDDACRLPRDIIQLARQGITLSWERSSLAALETGINEVDLWVAAARYTAGQQPSIASPDRPPVSQMTWPVVEPSPSGGGFVVPLA